MAQGAEGRCSPADAAGAQHPVWALLERVQAGRGCAAWEQGNKETHVIALQRATNSPENMVTYKFLLFKKENVSFKKTKNPALTLIVSELK